VVAGIAKPLSFVEAPRRDDYLAVRQEHDLPCLLELLREEYILGFVRVFTFNSKPIDIAKCVLSYRKVWSAEQWVANAQICSLKP